MTLKLSKNRNLKPVFSMAQEGEVFLYDKTYYLKISFDKAAKIGVIDDKLKDKYFILWEWIEFEPECEIDEIYPNVSITFD